MMDIKEVLLLWFTNFFDKKSTGSCLATLANKSAFNNEKLAQELQKPIIKKFERRAVYSAFKDKIWAADLADMQLISKFNKGLDFYCVLLIFLVNILGLFL